MKLTLPQQDVYFEQLMYPEDPIYNIGAKIIIEGSIVYEVLNKAYIALINQHDTYRSILNQLDEEVRIQTIEEHVMALEFVDFSSKENADAEANEFMQNTFEIPFQLNEKKALHKFILVKVDEELHYLFSVYHHIITDGWGTSLMFQRLVKNYNELSSFGKVETEYPFTYKDFIEDDSAYAVSEDYEDDKLYWKEKFESLPERLFEKIDQNSKPNQSKRREIIIKRAVYNQLEQVGKDLGATTFHVILGALYLYFGRKHQNKDFAIGLPVLNRGKSIFKKTVGLFMGVSPLRIQFDFEDNFGDLVKNIKQQLRQDYRHQRFPLGKLIKELELFQEKDRLFNITLSYEKQNYADHFVNSETRVVPLSHQSERVALAIYIREFDESEDVKIDFDYNINYFSESDSLKMVTHFENLLSAVISNPVELLSKYQYITESERQEIVENFNKTQFSYPCEATFITLFNEHVNKNPQRIALVDEHRAYTYSELDLLSNKIAAYLQKRNREKDSAPIAVLMNRSANLVVTLLGILKSGNAYIPLDPSFPKDRLEYIIEHSGVQQIIATQSLKHNLNLEDRIIDIEVIVKEEINLEQTESAKISALATAYIIYTSGSTGNPKGVAISHQSLLNFLISIQHQPKIEAGDYLFSVTTQSFDISILEFFAPLISGAKLYIASQELLSDPLAIVTKLKELEPSIIQATPSFYQMLYNAGWKGNKTLKILCGGDLLSEALAEMLLETNAELWNMYGPTETTIWSSCKKITQAKEASNIGKPIHNTQLYILDDCMQLLPVGSVGTIYIGGDGLAQGYFKNEALTNEKFIQNAFNKKERMYNTGDLGKWNEKGEIEFLGRNDNQVKIRGYRIELGEIETKLNQIENIKEAIVIAQQSAGQEAVLIAYVIVQTGTFNTLAIINTLREELPEYMIPHALFSLDEFPLTPNKKVDRKALSQTKIATEKVMLSYEKPTTEIEIKICNFYQEVLGIKTEIGITDNFFQLGGHSLNAVKLINSIDEKLHYRITLKDIFDYPTVQKLAKYLEKKQTVQSSAIIPVAERLYYEITSSQYNIWLASQLEEKSISYNMSAVFKIRGQIQKKVLDQVFLELQKKHEILRTNFVEIEGIPHQKISSEIVQISIDEFLYEEKERIKSIHDYVNRAFDLENETLLRVALFHQKNGDSYLVFCTHHIIMDGWSLEILVNEFVNKYKQIENEESLQDHKLMFQFKDYVAWYQEQLKNTNEANLKFWNKYLDGYSWKNNIPFDREDYEEKHIGADHDFVFDSIKFSELNEFAQQQNISLHTLLVGTFSMLVHKMYGEEDFCIGTINSGRTHSELHNQLGMFAKTLPLRNRIKSENSLSEILKETHQNLLVIDEHQDIPESVQNKLRLDVLLVLQNPSFSYTNISVNENLQLQIMPMSASYSRLPLLINFVVNEGNVSGTISYNATKYETATIEIIKLKYEKLLREIVENADKSLESIDIKLAIEKETTIDIGFNF
ncbi:amino acid adenylation domain-containing protein [Flavobacterium sp. 9]|uniref:non-ribosomal peptide synthetase n=1 Tax=Flavobacterium sp. 9 TaxID=2035198 RepID=UPI000C17B1F4|nr:non-ribosomal peptide synthetase [Flavobacterium sp. 9]PIF30211.1 amino acid adenylation domain-containing protein [Flavobacterium sp. 9]